MCYKMFFRQLFNFNTNALSKYPLQKHSQKPNVLITIFTE